MYILKVHTRGSIWEAKVLAGLLSSSRGGNFKIFRPKMAIIQDFSNRFIWPTKSITSMNFGIRACFNMKFIRVVRKIDILNIFLIKYRSASDIDVPPKATLPPRDRTFFLHPVIAQAQVRIYPKIGGCIFFVWEKNGKTCFFSLLKSVYEVKILENSKIP